MSKETVEGRSLLQILIDWIGSCPHITASPHILTDILENKIPGYAVAQTSGPTFIRRYIRQGDEFQSGYALYVYMRGEQNTQRQKNEAFLEDFQNWVLQKNKRRDYFIIPGGRVLSIMATNGMVYDVEENLNTTYQVQLILRYYKEAV